MRFKVAVTDKQAKANSTNVIVVKKRTSLVTVAMKGLIEHLEKNPDSENEETLKLAKAIQREYKNDLDVFLSELLEDLDISIHIIDLNNRVYENMNTFERKTSHDVGKLSYHRAWESQYHEEDGEKDFVKYLPDFETVVEHGNELMLEDIAEENGDWVMLEEE